MFVLRNCIFVCLIIVGWFHIVLKSKIERKSTQRKVFMLLLCVLSLFV